MKRILAVILALSMIISFTACGSKGPDVTGKYTAVSATYDGEDATESLNGEYIELKNGGKGTYYSGFEFDLEWKLSGETFTGTVSFMGLGEPCNGTLKDGVLSVTYSDWTYVMVKDGVSAPAAEAANTGNQLAGAYLPSGVQLGGQQYSYDDMVSMDMVDGTFLKLNADGTGEVGLAGETPDSMTFDEATGIITFSTGETLPFSVNGNTISVDYSSMTSQDMILYFVKEGSESDTTSDVAGSLADAFGNVAFTSPTTEIVVPSNWYGTVRFYDFVGADSDEQTEDVWAFFDYYDGKPYFEVWEKPNDELTEDDDALLSMYIIEDNQWIIPDIGDKDAWLIDTYLTSADTNAYNVKLENGALNIIVPYTGTTGSCTCQIFLREDGTLWDEASDPLPPSYDEYKAGIESANPEGAQGDNTSPASSDSYGKTTADATGIVDFDTLKAGFDWIEKKTSAENNYYRPTYEEIKEQFGGADGHKANDESWSDEYHIYEWITVNGDFALVTFMVLGDGSECYSGISWSPNLKD